jgi:hypothetical protein
MPMQRRWFFAASKQCLLALSSIKGSLEIVTEG